MGVKLNDVVQAFAPGLFSTSYSHPSFLTAFSEHSSSCVFMCLFNMLHVKKTLIYNAFGLQPRDDNGLRTVHILQRGDPQASKG